MPATAWTHMWSHLSVTKLHHALTEADDDNFCMRLYTSIGQKCLYIKAHSGISTILWRSSVRKIRGFGRFLVMTPFSLRQLSSCSNRFEQNTREWRIYGPNGEPNCRICTALCEREVRTHRLLRSIKYRRRPERCGRYSGDIITLAGQWWTSVCRQDTNLRHTRRCLAATVTFQWWFNP